MSRTPLHLPPLLEALTDEGVKQQLRAIGERVRDIVSLGIQAAQQENDLTPLATAHEIAMRMFEANNESYFALATGGAELRQSLACRSGCAYCCHLFVELTPIEAIALWRTLQSAEQSPRRQKLAETAPRLAGLTPDQRRAKHVLCPLISETGACTVYQLRPLACRGFYSTSAEDCEQALLTPEGAALPPIKSPAVPRALSAIIGSGINAALADHGLQHDTLELTSAVQALQDDPDAARRWLAGEKIFPPGLKKFDRENLKP